MKTCFSGFKAKAYFIDTKNGREENFSTASHMKEQESKKLAGITPRVFVKGSVLPLIALDGLVESGIDNIFYLQSFTDSN